ncbi:galectin-1-like [Trichosurus vulpecula]|uniref:galectin-1-like n=1 Tax=Trichosurus vulpecula TaxID=9337 RepID=UPI00186B341E|nr:galectin-1-like [Trichosurus vulpecula]
MAGECGGGKVVSLKDLGLKPGGCVKVKGDILPNARTFRCDLGKDEDNLGLHFNPRFNYLGFHNVIVCNSRTHGVWGKEQMDPNFPFKPDTSVEISITFEGQQFRVRMQNDQEITFPNRLDLNQIDYVAILADINVRKVDFEGTLQSCQLQITLDY